ncbi:MAG: CPBP family intramembrane metalloprotease [Clostridiales bacterium]|nr:CPBP family intramembrane metalloprotease [Clostridiales bacterium]
MNTKNKVLTVLRIAAALVVWFLIYKLLDNALDPYLKDKVPFIVRMIIEAAVIPYGIGLPVMYLIVKSMKVQNSTCPQMKPSAGTIATAFLIQSGLSFPVMIPVNIAYKLMGREMPGMKPEEVLAHPIYYLVLLLLFAPVVEEFLFRKIVLRRLTVLGTVPAVIISAVLFGIPHLFSQGPAQMLYTFVLGLVWGYMAVRTGKIWPSIILHSLSNLYGGILTALWPKDSAVTLLSFAVLYMMIMPCTAILLTVFNKKKIMLIKQNVC